MIQVQDYHVIAVKTLRTDLPNTFINGMNRLTQRIYKWYFTENN